MYRIKKDEYYLDIAKAVSQRSSCLNKHWGTVIVKDDTIISTGYNGAPRGVTDCYEKEHCRLMDYRKKNKLGRGTCYEQCLSVHAEMNAIIFADGDKLKDSTLYLYGTEFIGFDRNEQLVQNPRPCAECRKMIINAGIKHVVVRTDTSHHYVYDVENWSKSENDIVGTY